MTSFPLPLPAPIRAEALARAAGAAPAPARSIGGPGDAAPAGGPQNIGTQHSDAQRIAALRNAAVELEATFLAEMLKSAGLGKSPEGFGGGAGEDQFGSFLVQEQAREMARAGGIGLAESFFRALMEKENGNG